MSFMVSTDYRKGRICVKCIITFTPNPAVTPLESAFTKNDRGVQAIGAAMASSLRGDAQEQDSAASKDGFNFRVDGNVCGGDAVDRKTCAGVLGEMEETGDVIVLVKAGKQAFGFAG